MIVQVSSLCDIKNVEDVERLGVDVVGFDFRKDSSRQMKMVLSRAGIIPDYSPEVLTQMRNVDASENAYIVRTALRAGLFSDEMIQNIITRVYNFSLNIVELGGNERPLVIDNLRKTLVPDISTALEIRKFATISSASDMAELHKYDSVVDSFNLSFGSDDVAIQILNGYDLRHGFMLSFNSSNDFEKLSHLFSHEKCVGISLNDVLEQKVGVKSIDKLQLFLSKIKNLQTL